MAKELDRYSDRHLVVNYLRREMGYRETNDAICNNCSHSFTDPEYGLKCGFNRAFTFTVQETAKCDHFNRDE